MKRRLPAIAVLAAALVTVGCSVAPPATPRTTSSTPAAAAPAAADPAAWVDRVCAAGVTVATPAVARPEVTGTDLAAVQKTVSTYLGGVVTGVRQGRAQLDAAGASPIPGADGALARSRSVLDGLERSIADARAQVDAADPRDPAGFAATLGRVQSGLSATQAPDALRELLAVPGVAAVAGRSTSCTRLTALAARVPG